MTEEEFKTRLEQIIDEYQYDTEVYHIEIDTLIVDYLSQSMPWIKEKFNGGWGWYA